MHAPSLSGEHLIWIHPFHMVLMVVETNYVSRCSPDPPVTNGILDCSTWTITRWSGENWGDGVFTKHWPCPSPRTTTPAAWHSSATPLRKLDIGYFPISWTLCIVQALEGSWGHHAAAIGHMHANSSCIKLGFDPIPRRCEAKVSPTKAPRNQ